MPTAITAHTLKGWLRDGEEIGLFDVREHGQYGEGHLFFAVPLPYSVLEREIGRLAPNRRARLVVYDDGEQLAAQVAQRLEALGYTAVHVLEGGTRGWRDAGFRLFKGVNVPSKAFGELVEQIAHTPHVTAATLVAWQRAERAPVVLDGRPFGEYRTMNIPGAACCPNGELAYRIDAIVPDPRTPIVINCAGRTRSIVGAQTLRHLGIANPVYALENGTQGWYLADFALEHGTTRRYPAEVRASASRVEAARALATRAGVAWVSADVVRAWAAAGERTVSLCDVRTPEEFAAGSLPGAQHAPGGQLQQATDQYLGVRGARVVLFDDDGIRAPVTASWLRQLGHEAFVLEGGLRSGLALHDAPVAEPPPLAFIDAPTLAERLAHGQALVVDLRASAAWLEAHVPGSVWSVRPRLAALLAQAAQRGVQRVTFVADDARLAAWAVADLPAPGDMAFSVLEGGFAAWRAWGGREASGATLTPEARIDFLFFTHDRHAGNKAAARQYLQWEVDLLAQLDEDERGVFRPLS
ncbi:rhodanese-like domain-containing protein [Paraburkholderia acidisoli]|uniref:Sulfurtransferase n=1 Tax=Paraburkholderia acidisoli TaxID=2571748 RepID=A0A7Z2GKB1_9BURK|nr:rhodanese-like domain-containing protein [Paraburkholderia acidisoli]QGZ63298.1 sulfurtransferase [Paraburkholderia acidisoli]